MARAVRQKIPRPPRRTSRSKKGIQKPKWNSSVRVGRLRGHKFKRSPSSKIPDIAGSITDGVRSRCTIRAQKPSIIKCTRSLPDRPTKRKAVVMLKKERIIQDKEDNQEIDTQTDVSNAHPVASQLPDCQICTYKTNNKKTMQTHLKMHQVVKDFKCNLCPFWSNYAGIVRTHEVHYHPKEEVIEVPPAAKVNQGAIEQVISSSIQDNVQTLVIIPATVTRAKNEPRSAAKVTAIRPSMIFNCRICDFQTNFESGVRVHEKMHNVVRRFKCSLCPFYSDYRTVASNHEQTCHSSLTLQGARCAAKSQDISDSWSRIGKVSTSASSFPRKQQESHQSLNINSSDDCENECNIENVRLDPNQTFNDEATEQIVISTNSEDDALNCQTTNLKKDFELPHEDADQIVLRKSEAIPPFIDLAISTEITERVPTLIENPAPAQIPLPDVDHQTLQDVSEKSPKHAGGSTEESPSKINYRICSMCGLVLTDSEVSSHLESHSSITNEETVPSSSAAGHCETDIDLKEVHTSNLNFGCQKPSKTVQKCSTCKKRFASMIKFKIHKKLHKRLISSSETLKSKLWLKSKSSKLKCNICKYKTFNKLALLYHWRGHYRFEAHTCKDCGMSFHCYGTLVRHRRGVSSCSRLAKPSTPAGQRSSSPGSDNSNEDSQREDATSLDPDLNQITERSALCRIIGSQSPPVAKSDNHNPQKSVDHPMMKECRVVLTRLSPSAVAHQNIPKTTTSKLPKLRELQIVVEKLDLSRYFKSRDGQLAINVNGRVSPQKQNYLQEYEQTICENESLVPIQGRDGSDDNLNLNERTQGHGLSEEPDMIDSDPEDLCAVEIEKTLTQFLETTCSLPDNGEPTGLWDYWGVFENEAGVFELHEVAKALQRTAKNETPESLLQGNLFAATSSMLLTPPVDCGQVQDFEMTEADLVVNLTSDTAELTALESPVASPYRLIAVINQHCQSLPTPDSTESAVPYNEPLPIFGYCDQMSLLDKSSVDLSSEATKDAWVDNPQSGTRDSPVQNGTPPDDTGSASVGGSQDALHEWADMPVASYVEICSSATPIRTSVESELEENLREDHPTNLSFKSGSRLLIKSCRHIVGYKIQNYPSLLKPRVSRKVAIRRKGKSLSKAPLKEVVKTESRAELPILRHVRAPPTKSVTSPKKRRSQTEPKKSTELKEARLVLEKLDLALFYKAAERKLAVNGRGNAAHLTRCRSLKTLRKFKKRFASAPKMFKCCKCRYKTWFPPSFRVHSKHHFKNRQFSCKGCQFDCEDLKEYNQHMKYIHEYVMDYA